MWFYWVSPSGSTFKIKSILRSSPTAFPNSLHQHSSYFSSTCRAICLEHPAKPSMWKKNGMLIRWINVQVPVRFKFSDFSSVCVALRCFLLSLFSLDHFSTEKKIKKFFSAFYARASNYASPLVFMFFWCFFLCLFKAVKKSRKKKLKNLRTDCLLMVLVCLFMLRLNLFEVKFNLSGQKFLFQAYRWLPDSDHSWDIDRTGFQVDDKSEKKVSTCFGQAINTKNSNSG